MEQRPQELQLARRVDDCARAARTRTRAAGFPHPHVRRRLLPISVIEQSRSPMKYACGESPPQRRTPTPLLAIPHLVRKRRP